MKQGESEREIARERDRDREREGEREIRESNRQTDGMAEKNTETITCSKESHWTVPFLYVQLCANCDLKS